MDSGSESYRRFCDGADDALGEIITEYRDGLIFYIRNYVVNIDLAETLAEDVFFKLAVKKPKFRGKSSFKTWLYAIGRNEAASYLRKHGDTVPLTGLETASDDPESAYITDERKLALHKCIAGLRPDHRQVLWLFYFEDQSAKEIAVIIRKSPHNVETMLTRARAALKEKLEKEGFTYENV